MQQQAPQVDDITNACLSLRSAFILKVQHPHLHVNENGLLNAVVPDWYQERWAILLRGFRSEELSQRAF